MSRLNVLSFVFVLFAFFSASAQDARVQDLNDRIAEASRGVCLILKNPHSYGCNDWTFNGNDFFPLLTLDWMGRTQGNWSLVTYADQEGHPNAGPEFVMLQARNRPTIPAGVLDVKSGRAVGSVRISGNTLTFNNWKGGRTTSTPQSFQVRDRQTIQLQFVDSDRNINLFTCRNFDRSNTPHLICRWDAKKRANSNWQHKGYLGFLRTGN